MLMLFLYVDFDVLKPKESPARQKIKKLTRIRLVFSGRSPDVVRLNLRNRFLLKVQVSVWSGPRQTCFEATHSLKVDQVDWIDYNSSGGDADDEELHTCISLMMVTITHIIDPQ